MTATDKLSPEQARLLRAIAEGRATYYRSVGSLQSAHVEIEDEPDARERTLDVLRRKRLVIVDKLYDPTPIVWLTEYARRTYFPTTTTKE